MKLQKLKEAPLVTIIVITYNSSKYVLETLESAKLQSYRNVELIISDDCSTDNTTEICAKWIKDNEKYFTNIRLVQASENTGIPSNVNRGLKAATGEWIKLIAGDDILMENCVTDNLDFALGSNAQFVFSKPVYIDQNTKSLDKNSNLKKNKKNGDFYELSSKKQFLHLLYKKYPMQAPTIFFNKKIVNELGGFDEIYKNEDFPLYLKVTKAGYKLHYLNKKTVYYRIHTSSFSIRVRNDAGISYWEIMKLKETIRPYIDVKLLFSNPLIFIDFYNRLFFSEVVTFFGNNKTTRKKLRFIRWLSPIYLKTRFNKKLN